MTNNEYRVLVHAMNNEFKKYDLPEYTVEVETDDCIDNKFWVYIFNDNQMVNYNYYNIIGGEIL